MVIARGGVSMEEAVKVDNKQLIRNEALHLFYSKGYDAVGVQEIVNTAKITKPTLYYYFKSKYGLLQSILEDKGKRLNDELWHAAKYEGDIINTLQRIATVYMTIAAKDQEFFMFMNSLYYSARENEAYKAVQPYIIEQFCITRSVFEQASNQLGNMRGRQEQFTTGFIGIITHYILLHYEKGKPAKELLDQGIVYSLVHQFLHGIYS